MNKYIDVFNGDADGILSLIQLRKENPVDESCQTLVTGVKRDIKLVSRIDDAMAKESRITILDVSFDKNVDGVRRICDLANSVAYFDHHKADKLFDHPLLSSHIDTAPTVCTGLLVDKYLKGAQPLWAIASAYGDGMLKVADRKADDYGLSNEQKQQLQSFGMLINYNGYGAEVGDLHFAPEVLYKTLFAYNSPFDAVNDSESPYAKLKLGYEQDMLHASAVSPVMDDDQLLAVVLDDAAWSRRISGTLGNQLAQQNKDKAVVVVTHNKLSQGTEASYSISLRAPKNNPYGASAVCSGFATGGGREGAAGVNVMPANQLDAFFQAVSDFYR